MRISKRSPGRVALCIPMAAAALAMAGPGPQTGAQETTQPLRQDVTVTVKLIQAYVTGKDGQAVTDLTAADFEVTDNGKSVPVTHFERHIVGGDDISPAVPAKVRGFNRKFFLFFDFAFSDHRSALKARDAGLRFIDQELRPGDELGLLSYSASAGFTIHEYLTTDHARVRSIVDGFGLKSVVGRAESLTNFIYADELAHQDDVNSASMLGLAPPDDEFYGNMALLKGGGSVDPGRRQSYLDQARQYSQMFASLGQALRYIPGWKNIILFSGGIARTLLYGNRNLTAPTIDPNNPEATLQSMRQYDDAHSDTEVRSQFMAALKEIKNANSPIYAIDCSVPQGEVDISNAFASSTGARELAGKDSLVQLANESGGKYFANSMDYLNALQAIQDMTSAYYVLGYSIPARWDGEFHKVKVKVSRKGCKVASQNGYYNPKPFQEYSKFERLLQMTDLALSESPQTQIPARMTVAAIPVMVRGWMHLTAYGRLPKEAAVAVIGNNAEAYLMIFDEGQDRTAIKSYRLKLPEGERSEYFPAFILPINPGRYTCRFVIQNLDTGLGARGTTSIVIPQPESSALWLDPPLLLELARSGEDLGASPEATISAVFGYDRESYAPLVGDVSAGSSRLEAALRCTLGSPDFELGISAVLEDAQTGEAVDVPVAVLDQKQTGAVRTYVLELTPAGLKPGSYTLTVCAAEKNGRVESFASTELTVK
jgi:VWFA-related protein